MNEENALVISKPAAFDLSPQTFEQAITFSQYLAESDMVPKDFKGKAGNCLVAMQWGMEIGLKPLQSLQNIAVINGRPAIWGDALIAIVRSSQRANTSLKHKLTQPPPAKSNAEVNQSRSEYSAWLMHKPLD